MKIKILMVAFVLGCSQALAQKDDKVVIKYFFPDKVEMLIDSCIHSYKSEMLNFYFLLAKDSAYSITIGKYDWKERGNLLSWINQTNRYVVVNSEKYPLLFDYDLTFAGIDLNNVGTFGNREGNIKRAKLLLHGLTIIFNSEGEVVKVIN